jgi:hypothetical protein
VSEEEVNQVKTDYNKWVKQWRLRRKACLEVIDAICEMTDQRRKQFMENLGLDDDLDYNIDINKFPVNADL